MLTALVWPQTRLGLVKKMRSSHCSQASIRCNPFPYFTNKTFVASRKQVYIEDPVRNLDVHVILFLRPKIFAYKRFDSKPFPFFFTMGLSVLAAKGSLQIQHIRFSVTTTVTTCSVTTTTTVSRLGAIDS